MDGASVCVSIDDRKEFDSFINSKEYDAYEREAIMALPLQQQNVAKRNGWEYGIVLKDEVDSVKEQEIHDDFKFVVDAAEQYNAGGKENCNPNVPVIPYSARGRPKKDEDVNKDRRGRAKVVQRVQVMLKSAGLVVERDNKEVDGKILLKVWAPYRTLLEVDVIVNQQQQQQQQQEDQQQQGDGSSGNQKQFSDSERKYLLHHLLKSLLKTEKGLVGIYPLHTKSIKKDLYSSWMNFLGRHSATSSIHNNTTTTTEDASSSMGSGSGTPLCKRNSWIWYTQAILNQPLDEIAKYYGVEVAFYFAFQEFYSKWLVLPAIMGAVLLFTQVSNTTFDSPGVPFFCAGICIWATLFIEFWKRRSAVLAHRWGVSNYEDSEVVRPEFKPSFYKKSEITGRLEKEYQPWKRGLKILLSIPLMLLFVAICCGSMIYLLALQDDFTTNEDQPSSSSSSSSSSTTTSMIFNSIIWGIVVPIANHLYGVFAKRFNDYENWKTSTRYENSLIFKVFSFRFCNSFLSLFFYAFGEQDTGHLASQLGSFLLTGAMFQYFVRFVIPWINKKWHARTSKRNGLSSAWKQYHMNTYDTFEDYNVLMIQFGYVTFFSMAFPLAPLCALLNNILQIRTEAFRLCNSLQRPVSRKTSSIGSWIHVLQLMSLSAVLTNCALIGFTSKQINNYFPGISDRGKVLVVFLFEHILFCIKWVIAWFIPSRPAKVIRAEKKQKYLAHMREQESLKERARLYKRVAKLKRKDMIRERNQSTYNIHHIHQHQRAHSHIMHHIQHNQQQQQQEHRRHRSQAFTPPIMPQRLSGQQRRHVFASCPPTGNSSIPVRNSVSTHFQRKLRFA